MFLVLKKDLALREGDDDRVQAEAVLFSPPLFDLDDPQNLFITADVSSSRHRGQHANRTAPGL
ncbi:hypothetical protein [Streptomyces sp. LN245]|uniref:hypothetical protein n=1 Tax=Streptomyces sp. LN245 TaxID=3112975 RepID=UPI003711377D